MKLLIVDDEKLTRDGLMDSIDWALLGITELAQADDGLHGLETALTFRPDILLSDIRMPRMTGIEMAQRLQEENPSLSVIFMSGYSDKEYLKAAIKLKAVNYVEKPINLEEIKEAVTQACRQVLAHQEAENSKALSLSHSRALLASRLAMPPRPDMRPPVAEELPFPFPVSGSTPFFTLLIRFYHNNYTQDMLSHIVETPIGKLLSSLHIEEIHTVRQGQLFLYHLWGFKDYTDNQKNILGISLEEVLRPLNLHYHIVFGKNVHGMENIYASYNSAVIELQNAFFSEDNSHRIYKHRDGCDTFLDLSALHLESTLRELLLRKDASQLESALDNLLELLLTKPLLPNQVKDLYFTLLTTVRDTYQIFQIQNSDSAEPDNSIWGHISGCESVYELHALLKNRIAMFFPLVQNHAETHSAVYLIKEFIAGHYQDESLSIKDISEHVFLSSSYICTLFKNETGMTLNQYLTEYRIEKAKELLIDPRYKITDISSKVGYSDGNYFGKTFKKQVGMSPSEYRERKVQS